MNRVSNAAVICRRPLVDAANRAAHMVTGPYADGIWRGHMHALMSYGSFLATDTPKAA